MLERFARDVIDGQVMFKAPFARLYLEYEPNPCMRFQLVRTLECALIAICSPRFARYVFDSQVMFKALFARLYLEYEPNPLHEIPISAHLKVRTK